MKLIVTVWSVVSVPRSKEWNNTKTKLNRIRKAEGRQSERRVLRVHGFPTVNKAINFISPVLKLIRIGTAGNGEYNSTCLIRRTSMTSANYGLLRSTENLAPRSRGILPTFTIRSRMHGRDTHTHTHTHTHICTRARVHTYAVAFTKLARVLALWEISPLSAIWWAVRPNKPPRSLLCGVPSPAKAGILSVLHERPPRAGISMGKSYRIGNPVFEKVTFIVGAKHETSSVTRSQNLSRSFRHLKMN